MIAVIVIFTFSSHIQLVITNTSTLIVQAFNFHAKPFNMPIMNHQEIANEFSVLIASYVLFYYNDILKKDQSYLLGWFSICILGVNVLINIGFMAVVTVKNFKLKFIRFCNRRKGKKLAKLRQ